MSSLILIPPMTEINLIQDRLDYMKNLRIHNLTSEEIDFNSVKSVFFDLTFDFFNPDITLPFLWEIFASFHRHSEKLKTHEIELTIIRNYSFSSNREDLTIRQKVVDQFCLLLKEFYNAHEIYIPNLFSRGGLKKLKHPIMELVAAVQMGKTHRSKVTEKSRFFLLYDLDFASLFFSHIEIGIHRSVIVEGNELFLKQLNEKVQVIAGHAPVSFHHSHFVNYHYPDIKAKIFDEVHYEFENMMIDLINNLF